MSALGLWKERDSSLIRKERALRLGVSVVAPRLPLPRTTPEESHVQGITADEDATAAILADRIEEAPDGPAGEEAGEKSFC